MDKGQNPPPEIDSEGLEREVECLRKKVKLLEIENKSLKDQVLIGMKAFGLIDGCIDIINLMRVDTPQMENWRYVWLVNACDILNREPKDFNLIS